MDNVGARCWDFGENSAGFARLSPCGSSQPSYTNKRVTPRKQRYFRVAQEPNRKPEPSEPFSQEPNAEPKPPELLSRNRNRNRNRPLCETVLKHARTASLEEPPEPKTGTALTVPSPNRNRTEPNRGHPAIFCKTYFKARVNKWNVCKQRCQIRRAFCYQSACQPIPS